MSARRKKRSRGGISSLETDWYTSWTVFFQKKRREQTNATTQHGVPARAAGLMYSILRAHVTRFQSRYVGIISMGEGLEPRLAQPVERAR